MDVNEAFNFRFGGADNAAGACCEECAQGLPCADSEDADYSEDDTSGVDVPLSWTIASDVIMLLIGSAIGASLMARKIPSMLADVEHRVNADAAKAAARAESLKIVG